MHSGVRILNSGRSVLPSTSPLSSGYSSRYRSASAAFPSFGSTRIGPSGHSSVGLRTLEVLILRVLDINLTRRENLPGFITVATVAIQIEVRDRELSLKES